MVFRRTAICLFTLLSIVHPAHAGNADDLTVSLDRGIELYSKNKFLDAKVQFSQALLLAERKKDTFRKYSCMYNLALVARSMSDYTEAERLLKKIFPLPPKSSEFTHFQVGFLLAEVYVNEKKDAEAELLDKEMIDYAPELKQDPVLAAKVYTNLAAVLNRQAKTLECAKSYNKAMALLEPLSGERADSVRAQLLCNLGLVYLMANELAMAEKYEREAVNLTTKLYGLNDYRTATAIRNLGGVFDHQNKHSEAQKLFQQADAIHAKVESARAEYARRK